MSKKHIEPTLTLDFDDAPHFSDLEFARLGCSKSDMQPASLRRLERLREVYGCPIVLTSAYRTPRHEVMRGRPSNGAHTIGCAFDIACTDNLLRYKLVAAALEVGFHRIGIGKNFIHVDDSNVHPAPRIWTYYK